MPDYYDLQEFLHQQSMIILIIYVAFISECAKHCSLCYNETLCFECTQGFYLEENGECQRKWTI